MKLSIQQVTDFVSGIILYGDSEKTVESVSIDTRTIEPGALFVPLPGQNVNGSHYINRAIKEGANAVFVSKEEQANVVAGIASRKGCAAILVENELEALADLARGWLALVAPTVIAITGSTGKTSTKEIMLATLKERKKVHANKGNYNNEIGVPLTVLGADEDCEVLIVEMGMRGSGQIKELCSIAKPDIGVITSIGLSHVELLGNLDNIAAAKAELLEALDRNGLAVFDADTGYSDLLISKCQCRYLTCGIDCDDAQIMATHVELDAAGCASAHIMSLKGQFDINLTIPGRHHLSNALKVIAVAQELGFPDAVIEHGLRQAKQTGMRFKIELDRERGITYINDAYNANPQSCKQSILTLAGMHLTGKRVVVLGDMLELGDYAREAHKELGAQCSENNVDAVFAYGEFAPIITEQAISGGISVAQSYDWLEMDLLIDDLRKFLTSHDTCLIKGSRSMELERVVEAMLQPHCVTTADLVAPQEESNHEERAPEQHEMQTCDALQQEN